MERGEKTKMKKFVTFEGIDGSGKSTVSKLVYKKLKSEGYNVVLTFEPTDTWIGKIVQDCIQTDTDPFVTAFSFLADRVEHCKKIKDWLEEDKIVLCDRYAESTYAYQGAQMEDVIDNPIKLLKDLSKNLIIIPDTTFLFLIDPKLSLNRIEKRKNLIPFERLTFLKKVHKNYLNLANESRFIKIDANNKIDEIVMQCYNNIIEKV
jgi:dTMP kinase